MKKNLYTLIKLHNKYVRKIQSQKIADEKSIRLQKKIKNIFEKIEWHNKFRRLKLSFLTSGIIIIGANNVSGQINFGATQTNPFNIPQASGTWSQPRLVDLDGDGDKDITNFFETDFIFIENIGSATTPNFTIPDTNIFNLPGNFIYPNHDYCDLDNDGDFDLMIYEYGSNFKYYENIGSATNPSFGPAQTNPFNLSSTTRHFTPAFVDLDNDGDFDIMMGSYLGGFTYYENIGTASSPSFAAETTNPFNLLSSTTGAYTKLDFADLDNDGDLDLMSAFSITGGAEIRYYENTGTTSSPSFAAAQIDPFGLPAADKIRSCSFGDLDGDGDMDLLSTDIFQDLSLPGNPWVIDYLYYENTTPNTSSISENNNLDVTIYPNPANDQIIIETLNNENIKIINVLGETVYSSSLFSGINTIDISALSKGVYLIQNEMGNTTKLIKK